MDYAGQLMARQELGRIKWNEEGIRKGLKDEIATLRSL